MRCSYSSTERLLYPGPSAGLSTLSSRILQKAHAIGISVRWLPDEEIDMQRRKIFCRKVSKLESAESRASVSRVRPLLVFPEPWMLLRMPSENAPDKCCPGFGLGVGEGGSRCLPSLLGSSPSHQCLLFGINQPPNYMNATATNTCN